MQNKPDNIVKYIYLIGQQNRLRNFSFDGSLAIFSCPICGDSKKNKLKTRGNIFKYNNRYLYKCYNCGVSYSFKYFLKLVFPDLYKDYLFENFRRPTKTVKQLLVDLIKPTKTNHLKDLIRIIDLPINHPAALYVFNRKLPKSHLLYYTDNFKKYINKIIPNKFYRDSESDPRIVIPLFSKSKKLLGVQGRSILDTVCRYITIKFDSNNLKMFGVERLDFKKRIYIVEGVFDSLFLDNSVAVLDSSLYSITLPNVEINNITLVWDNEPRNVEITKLMQRGIRLGFNVCIWNKKILQKDLNLMFLSGMNINQIKREIDSNTFSGLLANLKLKEWKKYDNF